jgi:hypothetical protein
LKDMKTEDDIFTVPHYPSSLPLTETFLVSRLSVHGGLGHSVFRHKPNNQVMAQ